MEDNKKSTKQEEKVLSKKKVFAYERTETETKSIIVFNTWNMYIMIGAMLVAFFAATNDRYIIALIGAAIVVVQWIINIMQVSPVNAEIKEGLKKGNVTMTGGKYSISNPVVATIKKNSNTDSKQGEE